MNLTFALRDSMFGDAQDAPCNVVTAFSGRVPTYAGTSNIATGSLVQTPVCGWLGCLKFKKPYKFPRSSTLTARVTPTFSFDNGSAVTRREYRIVGVLSGHRLVWRR